MTHKKMVSEIQQTFDECSCNLDLYNAITEVAVESVHAATRMSLDVLSEADTLTYMEEFIDGLKDQVAIAINHEKTKLRVVK